MSLSPYAEAFIERGYACLVFDYRRWGASGLFHQIFTQEHVFTRLSSDGTPRHVLIVKEQLQDYRTVIEYARQQPEFDAHRIVIWGSSFSGTFSKYLVLRCCYRPGSRLGGHAITLSSEVFTPLHSSLDSSY